MQIVLTDFVMFQTIKHQIACATMQQEAYHTDPRHLTARIFTTFQMYNFNVHQIVISGGKFNICLARACAERTAQNSPTTRPQSSLDTLLHLTEFQPDLRHRTYYQSPTQLFRLRQVCEVLQSARLSVCLSVCLSAHISRKPHVQTLRNVPDM